MNQKHPDKKGFPSSLETNLAESHRPSSPEDSLLSQLMQQAV